MNPNSIFSASDISRLKPLVSAETLAALEAIERDDYLPSVFTDTEGEEIDHETLCKISLKQWEFDALEQHVFQLGERVFVPIGACSGVITLRPTASRHAGDPLNQFSRLAAQR